jgi:diguanylate cyclase (GGDEF)-like protein
MGMNFRDFTNKESLENVEKAFYRVVGTLKSDRVHDWVIVRKNGLTRHIEASLAPIRDASRKATGIRGIMRDVTKRKKAEETITFMAYHDTLTGLPNRVLFDDRLSLVLVQARRSQQKFALAMLDLDNFKDINDTLGHHMGDRLLRRFGTRLQSRLRKGDTVARIGGDEFMILFPDVKKVENCLALAQKIVESLRHPFYLGVHKLKITSSVGIAIYPDDGTDFETLKERADASMYKAKEFGRDNFQRYIS